jgi:hypothetical protein
MHHKIGSYERLLLSAVFLAIASFFTGCGENCQQSIREGDFEFSQGNYPRALAHYKKAETLQNGACKEFATAKIKLVEEISGAPTE